MMNQDKLFQVVAGEGYVTIRFLQPVEFSKCKGFEQELEAHYKEPFPHVVFDCEGLHDLDKDWVRFLLKTQTTLKNHVKLVRLIHVSNSMKNQLKREGLSSAFKVTSSLREAMVDFDLVTKKKLDTDFINPFLAATAHVIKIQAGIESEPQKIHLKTEKDKFYGDVSGIIAIVNDSFNGSVVISFPELTFLKIMSGILGEPCTELSKDIVDGAGEITNMIFGQAKVVLNEKGYALKMAIPSVVTGKDHSLTPFTKGPVVVVPFKSAAGDFFIEICVS